MKMVMHAAATILVFFVCFSPESKRTYLPCSSVSNHAVYIELKYTAALLKTRRYRLDFPAIHTALYPPCFRLYSRMHNVMFSIQCHQHRVLKLLLNLDLDQEK